MALDLPNSVQGLLLAQIDRLAVEARHTLQMASVIGRTFLYKVLAALAAGAKNLDQQLLTLETQGYIQQKDPTDLGLAYAFRHILIQESAYGTLLYVRRRAFHRQVAQALERLFPTYIAEQAGLLAYHYEQAEDLDQAIVYHLQTADDARLLYANEEAEAVYQKVLKLFDLQEKAGRQPDLERRAKTYLKIAQVRSNALDFEGAQAYYELAFDLLVEVERTRPRVVDEAQGRERVMRLGVDEPETLDPGLSEATASLEIVADLFEGLVELDTGLNVIPAAARRWQVDKSGRIYKFELRPNLRWSDNVPLTAHDFVFAWHRNLNPKTEAGLAHLLYIVQGAEEFNRGQTDNPNTIAIKALNELNLEIKLKIPAGYFPYLLTRPITFPQPTHIIQNKGVGWSKPKNLVCNGPFRIAAWKENQRVHLEKNPYYRGFIRGNLDKVSLLLFYPTLDHYMNQEIDWCPVDQVNLPTDYREEILLVQYLSTYFLGFSCNHLPFNQRLVRQAFARSIDQTEWVKRATSNVQKPSLGGVVPPGIPGHSPEIGLRFDPVMARDFLRQAGWKSGTGLPPLTFALLPETPGAQHLQKSWRKHLGVNVDFIENMPIDEIVTKLSAGTIQLALLAWEVEYPDPDSILRVVFHSTSPLNCFGWQNKLFDQLVDEAASLTYQQARLALYHQADKILVAEDTAIVPLFYYQAYGLMRPRFKVDGSGKIIRGGRFKFKNIIVT